MEIVSRNIAHRGHRYNTIVQTLRTRRGEQLEREFLSTPGAVVVLPTLPDGRVVLVQNFRHALNTTLLELPAGGLAPGEPIEQAAFRELEEETGFRAGKVTKLLEFYPSPGLSDEVMTLYWATDLTPGPQRTEIDEELSVTTLSAADAQRAIRDGRICDAKSIIGVGLFLGNVLD